MSDFDPPMLIVAFELERQPRPLNAKTLSEDELLRLVDWLASHERIDWKAWLERHLAKRQLRQAA